MKHATTIEVIAKVIAALLLFGALGRHSYDYYAIVRWTACGVFAFTSYQAWERSQHGWLAVFVICAVILNPIVPLHLKRDTWALTDIAAAVLLLISIAIMDTRKPKQ